MSKVSPTVFDVLKQHVVERPIRAGESIETQGERPSFLIMVKFGLFKSERINAWCEQSAIGVLGRGRILGYSNLFRQPAIMSVTAMTPARVCQVPIAVVFDHAFVDREFRHCMYDSVRAHIENVAEWAGLIRESNISKRLLAALDLIAEEEGSRTLRIPGHSELGLLVVARRESVARHISVLLKEQKLLKLDRWRAILRPTAEELRTVAQIKSGPKHASGGDE